MMNLLRVLTVHLFLLVPRVSPVPLSKVENSEMRQLPGDKIDTLGISTEETESVSAVISRIQNAPVATDEFDENIMIVEVEDVEVDTDQRNENFDTLNEVEESNIEQVKMLEEIWEGNEIIPETLNFKSRNIYDKHPQDQYEVSSSKINASSENKVELYMTHGIIMIVFIVNCAVVIMKIMKRSSRPASISVSQEMAKDLGYTKLDNSVREKEDKPMITQFRSVHKMQ